MAAIFTYGFEISKKNFEKSRVELATLSDYTHLIEEAVHRGYIDNNEIGTLQDWRKEPNKWKQ